MEACAGLPVHGLCGGKADWRMSFYLSLIIFETIDTKVKKLSMFDKKHLCFIVLNFGSIVDACGVLCRLCVMFGY